MNFTDYQTKARATAKYPFIGRGRETWRGSFSWMVRGCAIKHAFVDSAWITRAEYGPGVRRALCVSA
jgi:hypothetical protein